MRRTRVALSVVVSALAVGSVAIGTPATAAPGDVDVQLLALSDFHGRFAPQSGGDGLLPDPNGVDGPDEGTDPDPLIVGGAAFMATLLDQRAADFAAVSDNEGGSYFVGAGDLISASPFESSVFKDEPTIEVLNAMGLDYSSVGNHEFDRGFDELKRIIDGGCTGTVTVDSCFTDSTGDTTFDGADFPYLGANVTFTESGLPALQATAIQEVTVGDQTVRLGLIGVVTSDTPNLVTPDGIAGLTFEDEATAINREALALQEDGVEAIAVLIHEGGTQARPSFYNTCNGLTGPIVDINANTTAAVDLIISAHSHVPYDCVLDDPAGAPRPVTQAGFYGKAITDIRMEINSTSGEVDRATITADNIPVTRDVPADPEIQRIVDYWLAQSAGPRAVVLGTQSADLDRAYLDGSSVRSAESGFGNLIADAQLAALAGDPTYGNVVAAFMNPGGIRADINCADTPSGEPVGTITFGEAFTAQPFSNTVNAVRLSGTAIDQILEQQWRVVNGAEQFLALSVSATLQYSYDPRLPLGERIAPGAITINGVPVDPAGEYDVVANSFLTSGGDGFAAFTTGTTPITGPNDVDALAAYIAENSPVAPPALGRAISLDPARPQVDDGSGTGPCDLPVAPPGPVPPGPVPPGPVAPGPVAPGAGPPGKPGPVALPAPGLPATGVPTGELSVLAGLLLLSGAGACVVGRPRRRGAVLTD